LNIDQVVEISPVIPVVTIECAGDAVGLCNALLAGGIGVVEITLRTNAALAAIEAIVAEVPDMVVGAGSVICADDVEQVCAAGCHFIVSPGATPSLCDAMLHRNIGFLPGAMTPAEMMFLLEKGYRYQKFFPASLAGGREFLQALAGPLSQLRFCPTGGISPTNATDFLDLANVACVGGSWIAPAKDISRQDFQSIEVRSRDAMALRRRKSA